MFENDGFRHSIPTGAVYNCLTSQGHTVVNLDAFTLAEIPVANGDVTCTAPVTTSKIDVIFAIDTTGSMSPYIQGAVSVASDVVNTLVSKGVDYRVGLVDYKDADNCGNYDAVTDLGFTNDKAAIINAINALPGKVGGGCDTPEDVYSGLMRAIGFPWRDGVKKEILLMGDAPPKDPEPHTGFTAAGVIAAANAVDPAAINPVLVGGDPNATSIFTTLADGTGGQAFDSSSSDVAATILDALNTIITGRSCDHIVTGKATGVALTPETWCLRNADMTGAVNVPAGGSLVLTNSSVSGALTAKGADFIQVCGSHIVGGIDIEQSTSAVVLGDLSNHACKPNTLSGVVLKNNAGGVTVSNNDAQSVVLSSNVGPPVTVEANNIHDALACMGNTPPPSDNGHHNTVGAGATGQCSALGSSANAIASASTSSSSTSSTTPALRAPSTIAPATSIPATPAPTTTSSAPPASAVATTTTTLVATTTSIATTPASVAIDRCSRLRQQYAEAVVPFARSQIADAMKAAGCPVP